MARKTVNVSSLVDTVNEMLKGNYTNESARDGICLVIEEVLHSTGNYKGFRFLSKDEVPEGEKPGVNIEPELFKDYATRFKDTDLSRRMYF